MAVPYPTGSTIATLLGVTCPSARSCFAVGDFYPNNTLLVEHWNGSNWGIMTGIRPAGATATVLSGVACPALHSCFAVGNEQTGAGNTTLVEHWNGTHWNVMTTPDPADATIADLVGVSCPDTTTCSAVGYYQRPTAKSLTEHYG